jgi:cyclophilin family peptidyl-prolyl cis-trans isomerase
MSQTHVQLQTSLGAITIELYPEKAPLTVENFLSYVENDFYNGTIFHRVIKGFMIQGGGFSPEMDQKETSAPVKNEATNGLTNSKGTIAMARTMVVDSATSQFFINLVDNPHLDHQSESPQGYGYCVFGKVTEGMDIVEKIGNVATSTKGSYQNVPEDSITIESIARLEAAQ